MPNKEERAKKFLSKIIEPTNMNFRSRVPSTDGMYTEDIKTLTLAELLCTFSDQELNNIEIKNTKQFLQMVSDFEESSKKKDEEIKRLKKGLEKIKSFCDPEETSHRDFYLLATELITPTNTEKG